MGLRVLSGTKEGWSWGTKGVSWKDRRWWLEIAVMTVTPQCTSTKAAVYWGVLSSEIPGTLSPADSPGPFP